MFRIRLQKRLAQMKAGDPVKEQDPLAGAFENHLETGFQLATFQGPLCAEPVEGMAYFVEAVTLDQAAIAEEQGSQLIFVYLHYRSRLTVSFH